MTDPFLHLLRTVLMVLGLALLLLAAHALDHLHLPPAPVGAGQVDAVDTTIPSLYTGPEGRGGSHA